MIPQNQISKLSNRLYQEMKGQRISELVLERDYCIAWFLVGLARVSLRKKLVFKGGTALKRCYFAHYRFSEDLDFTLLEDVSFEALKGELEHVYAEVKKASNITFGFSREDSQSHQNSYTFYLGYEGPLSVRASMKEIKVDVTRKEHLVYLPEQRTVLKSYAEYSDLPVAEKIQVYPLHEIATEKTVALLDRARTEPRDLYDLWYLLVFAKEVEIAEIKQGIQQKLQFRQKSFDDVRQEFGKKEARLQKTWDSRLASQMNGLPEFEEVYRAVKRELRQIGVS